MPVMTAITAQTAPPGGPPSDSASMSMIWLSAAGRIRLSTAPLHGARLPRRCGPRGPRPRRRPSIRAQAGVGEGGLRNSIVSRAASIGLPLARRLPAR